MKNIRDHLLIHFGEGVATLEAQQHAVLFSFGLPVDGQRMHTSRLIAHIYACQGCPRGLLHK